MKLDKFWIVTHPGPVSTLNDIVFETDIAHLENQFKGGLQASEIYGTYTDKDEAWTKAERLLSAYQDFRKKITEDPTQGETDEDHAAKVADHSRLIVKQCFKVLGSIKKLWDKHGFGDDEDESGPVYRSLREVIAMEEDVVI